MPIVIVKKKKKGSFLMASCCTFNNKSQILYYGPQGRQNRPLPTSPTSFHEVLCCRLMRYSLSVPRILQGFSTLGPLLLLLVLLNILLPQIFAQPAPSLLLVPNQNVTPLKCFSLTTEVELPHLSQHSVCFHHTI